MTAQPNITPNCATKQLNSIIATDRLAFRNALDHFGAALSADWRVIQNLAILNTSEGCNLGRNAADAWALCLDALRTVRDMKDGHDDLRTAAMELIETTPGFHPDRRQLLERGQALRELHENDTKRDANLTELLFEAMALNELHYANAVFIREPRAA